MSDARPTPPARRAGRATLDEQRALAFGQLPGLLALGLGLAEAVHRAAEGLPMGPLRGALLAGATAIERGRAPAEALAAALPEPLRPVLEGPEETVPERLELLAEHLRAELTVASHARAAASYPLFVGIGAVVIAGVVTVVRLVFGGVQRALGAPDGASGFESLLLLGIAAVLLGTSMRALRAGTVPLWARALPGARCFAVRAAQRFAANLALLLDHRGGVRSEVAAVALSAAWLPWAQRPKGAADLGHVSEARGDSVETLIARLGLPDSARFSITLGQLMGDTAEGARRAQAELGAEAELLGRRYVFAMGLSLMLFAALCVVLALPGVELLRMTLLLRGG